MFAAGQCDLHSSRKQIGIEHDPGGDQALMNPTETVLLLLDHQLGLFQTVKDISVAELRALIPEIRQFVPHAIYVPRKGEVNAWDNKLFVETVRKTGKKTLIIAGVWTSVCV